MVFSVTLSFRPGSSVTTRPTFRWWNGCSVERRAGLADQRLGHRQHVAGHRERDDLHRGHQVLRRHHRVVRQGADGQRFVDRVQAIDHRRIDAQQARHLGRQVHPPGGRAGAREQRRDQRLGQAVGRDVLRHVARFQPGDDDLLAAGLAQRGHRALVQHRSLADHPLADALRVRHDGAAGFVQRDRAEFHAASGCFCGTGAPRRTATSSAMIDSAISGAVTASMLRPTGPWMRASAASPWPSSRSRFSRAAWVRREPSEPM